MVFLRDPKIFLLSKIRPYREEVLCDRGVFNYFERIAKLWVRNKALQIHYDIRYVSNSSLRVHFVT